MDFPLDNPLKYSVQQAAWMVYWIYIASSNSCTQIPMLCLRFIGSFCSAGYNGVQYDLGYQLRQKLLLMNNYLISGVDQLVNTLFQYGCSCQEVSLFICQILKNLNSLRQIILMPIYFFVMMKKQKWGYF